MRSVVIEEPAFISMVAAAIEVYNKETCGVLLGKKRKQSYIVKHTVTYQIAERKKSAVTLDSEYEERVNRANYLLGSHRPIGDYHSHIDGPMHLSKCDKKDLQSSGEGLSLLLVIKKTKKQRRWGYDSKNRRLVGSVGDEFSVSIMAYYYDHIRRRIFKIPLRCTYMKKLNKRLKRQK